MFNITNIQTILYTNIIIPQLKLVYEVSFLEHSKTSEISDKNNKNILPTPDKKVIN